MGKITITKEEFDVLKNAKEILEKYYEQENISANAFNVFGEIVNLFSVERAIELSEVNQEQVEDDDTEDEEDTDIFAVSDYLDGCIIDKYIGFDDSEIVIPKVIRGKKVLAVGKNAFYNTSELKSVELPNSIVAIFESAFEVCRNLETVNLKEGLRFIDSNAFYGTGIRNLLIPSTVFFIGHATFARSSIEKLRLSDSIAYISKRAFWKCECLKDVVIPDGIRALGQEAFFGCRELNKVELPSSLETIEKEAFCNCLKLKEINIPNSVTSIGIWAFSNSYTIQPDKRYNPRTGYRNMDLTINCFPGTVAQEYARKYGYKMSKCSYDFQKSKKSNSFAIDFIYANYSMQKDSDLELAERIKEYIKSISKDMVYCEVVESKDTCIYHYYMSKEMTEDQIQYIKEMTSPPIDEYDSTKRIRTRLLS